MLSTDTSLLQRRQALRDQIWHFGPEKLEMESWATVSIEEFPVSVELEDINLMIEIDLEDCGTTCCAAGHGAVLMNQPGLSVEDIADFYGLDIDAFWPWYWNRVNIDDWNMSTANDERYEDALKNLTDSDERLAQIGIVHWSTVIEYLDRLIKSD